MPASGLRLVSNIPYTTQYCLGVPPNATGVVGAPLGMFPCDTTTVGLVWQEVTSTGQYMSSLNGLCIGVTALGNGIRLIQTTCTLGGSQYEGWTTDNNLQAQRLMGAATYCMDVYQWNLIPYNPVTLWSCNLQGQQNQQWTKSYFPTPNAVLPPTGTRIVSAMTLANATVTWCLGVRPGTELTIGASLALYACDTTTVGLVFQYDNVTGRFTSALNGWCITAATPTNGANLIQQTCGGSWSTLQAWTRSSITQYIQLVSNTSFCFDNDGWTLANGNKVGLWSCNTDWNQGNQQWRLVNYPSVTTVMPASGTRVVSRLVNTTQPSVSWCLGARPSSLGTTGATMGLYPCDTTSVRLVFQYDSTTGRLTNAANGLCASVTSVANGVPITQQLCGSTYAAFQNWTVDSTNGYLRLGNNTAYCIDDTDWHTYSGNNVTLWECQTLYSQGNQQWDLNSFPTVVSTAPPTGKRIFSRLPYASVAPWVWCLGVPLGAESTAGASLGIYQCDNTTANYVFTYNATSGRFVSSVNGYCITAAAATSGSALTAQPCTAGFASLQAFDYDTSNYGIVFRTDATLCFDVNGWSTTAGNGVSLYSCNTASWQTNQRWSVEDFTAATGRRLA